MRIEYRKRYCVYSFITSLISLIIAIISSLFDNIISIEYVAIFSLVIYVVMIVFWGMASRKIDFYIIFLSCTYIFYYGRYFLLLINRERYYNEFVSYYDERFLNSVAIFILICIVTMNGSFVLFVSTHRCKSIKSVPILCRYKYNTSALKIVAWVMFGVSFVFSIQILLMNIQNTQMYGYAYALRYYYSGFRVERFFSVFLPGSFIMLIVIYKKSKVLKLVLSTLVLYVVLYFASGSRLQAILLILALILVYELEFRHLTRSKLLKIGGALLVLCFLLIIISSVRNSLQYSNTMNEVVHNIQEKFAEDNFLLELINECGFQINSIAVVMRECPDVVEYNYGVTYLKGIGQLMPNLFWSQNPFMQESTDTIFSYYLNRGTFGIGSSFIAEAYYNFGYFSVVFMVFAGWLFAKYQIGLTEAYIKDNNLLLRYFYLSIPTFALFYVRSDAVGLLKAVVYRCFIPCIAVILLSSILRRGKESN